MYTIFKAFLPRQRLDNCVVYALLIFVYPARIYFFDINNERCYRVPCGQELDLVSCRHHGALERWRCVVTTMDLFIFYYKNCETRARYGLVAGLLIKKEIICSINL